MKKELLNRILKHGLETLTLTDSQCGQIREMMRNRAGLILPDVDADEGNFDPIPKERLLEFVDFSKKLDKIPTHGGGYFYWNKTKEGDAFLEIC